MSFIWPDDTILPPPTISGFSGDIAQSTIRTNMDSGRPRQRMRFTSGWRSISVSWEFSDEEFRIFQAIHKFKLNGGNDFFDMELALGDDIDTYTVRFVGGRYKYKYQAHMYWVVSAELENSNTSVMTEEELDVILGD